MIKFERYYFVDVIKGVAIVGILMFHMLRHEDYDILLGTIIKYGGLGNLIFFILSGFGISCYLRKNEPTAKKFLKKRFFRIYSTYIIALLFAAIIIPIIVAFLSTLKGYPLKIIFYQYTLLEWIQIVTLTRVFSSNDWRLFEVYLPLNAAYWFISIIVQFYLLIGLALYFKKQFSKIIILVTVLSVLSFLPFLRTFIPYGLFIPFWIYFSIGMLLEYSIYHGFHDKFLNTVQDSYHFIIILYIVVSSIVLKFFFSDLLFSVFIAGFLALFYPYDSQIKNLKMLRLFSLLGVTSYSIYLMHSTVNHIVVMFLRNLVPLPMHVAGPLIQVPIIIILCIAWYVFFESPRTFSEFVRVIRNPAKSLYRQIYSIYQA